ncbi:ThiF family adenylyltransferase [Bengtsoniella intestinalis]|uniref:ThiF family adenylyltransferase n=1 Tax=Bengtsoniella intestinalis TaxID=3073143 RepID=UPI00391FAE68
MKFSKTRPIKIVMLGAGGTGGHIAPHLYRLLYALDRPVSFILCDGDLVEQKNLVRQNFIAADIGQNKAKVLAERYSAVFGLETQYIPGFIEDIQSLKALLTPQKWQNGNYPHSATETELVILIGAVDNNKSRQLCHQVFYQMKELIYIDAGNGEYAGQVVCGIRRAGRTYFKPVGTVYPDVLELTDKFPTELSCAETSVSAPQSMTANITAATIVVDMIYNILTIGNHTVRQATFSTKGVHVRPTVQSRKSRRIAA